MRLVESTAPIGGEVTDLDLREPLDAAQFATFAELFYQRSVLVVRNQELSGDDLLRFASNFGEPDQHFLTHYAHPEYPKILIVSNIEENGKPIGFADAGRVWHSDGSYMQRPAAVTMLYALEVPHDGEKALGSTQFASAWAAYDQLDNNSKVQIEGRQARHQVGGRRRAIGTGLQSDRAQEDQQPVAIHPIVRTHPHTGRRYLFVSSGECGGVVGMEDEQAASLIDELATQIQKPEFRHIHQWQVGDLLIWDNQAVQHLASFDYQWPQHRRKMHRVTILE